MSDKKTPPDGEPRPSRYHPLYHQRRLETPAERKLREMTEQFDSEKVSASGKKLNFKYDPNVPADQRVAFTMLHEANMAPEWIERGKALRHDLKQLTGKIDRAVREYDRAYAAAEMDRSGKAEQLRKNARDKWNSVRRKLATKAADYNRDVLNYNLSLPPGVQHKHFFDFDKEVEKRLRKT